MNISDYAPFIAVGVLFLSGIVLLVSYLRKMRKSKPLTPRQIPNIPGSKEASSHFSALPPTQPMNPQPEAYTAVSHRKTGMAMIVLILFLIISTVLGVSYFISRPKPQAIKEPLAANPNHNPYLHRVSNVGEVRGDKLVAGSKFSYGDGVLVKPSDGSAPDQINLQLAVKIFHCPEISDPDVQTCSTLKNTDSQLGIIHWKDQDIEVVGGVIMDERCGVYTVETSFTPFSPNEPDPGKGGQASYNWGIACTETSQGSTPAVTTSPAPIGSNLQPTLSPTPSPTASAQVPTATLAPTRTPTPTIFQQSAPRTTLSITPTPTEIILVQASTSPQPTSITSNAPTVVPTLPSAGIPLPVFAIGIPLLLIGLAFLL